MTHSRAVLSTISQPCRASWRSAATGRGRGGVLADVVVGRQQEAAGAAGRVADGLARPGLHHVDHGLDERPRGEVLARARLDVLGVLLQQPFVDVGLDVDVEAGARSRRR
jgi:hypothetical protein